MPYCKKVMISTTPELDTRLKETIHLVNKNRLTGELSMSKIIRVAIVEWIDRQERALQILNEKEVHNGISV